MKNPAERKPGGAFLKCESLLLLDDLAHRVHGFADTAPDMTLSLLGFTLIFEVVIANRLAGLLFDGAGGFL
jgi:hypothetical protein